MHKKLLKESTYSIFEDSTTLNQNLLFELKVRPEVEAAWILGGYVWVTLKGPEKFKKKMKISINDNLDTKLNKAQISQQAEEDQPTIINTPSLNPSLDDPLNLSTSSLHNRSLPLTSQPTSPMQPVTA
jgi:hypothetical protein